MKIKVGDRYKDYMNVSYVVKEYKDNIIIFEVDGGNCKDEKYTHADFVNEFDGNRFHKDKLIPHQTETKKTGK
jgi:hypothetical protein